jgi:hypothetical protein
MIERILTIAVVVWFLLTSVIGVTLSTLDLIYFLINKHFIFEFPDFFIINIIMTPPIGLILIYLGKGLDILLKLKEK